MDMVPCKHRLENAGLKAEMQIWMNANEILSARLQEQAQQFEEFVRDQQKLVREITTKFKKERKAIKANREKVLQSRIMRLEEQLKQAELGEQFQEEQNLKDIKLTAVKPKNFQDLMEEETKKELMQEKLKSMLAEASTEEERKIIKNRIGLDTSYAAPIQD